jgi:hypothetical protein
VSQADSRTNEERHARAADVYGAYQRRKVLELTNDPRNARLHSERSIESVMASLRQFGQRKPIVVTGPGGVVPEGIVVAGNGTLEAARRLGWDELDVSVWTPQSEAEMRAFALADNRTAELSEWDGARVAELIQELNAQSYDIASTGWNQDEIAKILAASQAPLDLAGPANPPQPPEAVGLPEPQPGVASSLTQGAIRVVQLFMTAENHAQWEAALRSLSGQFGTRTVSDTVVRAVFEAAGVSIPPELQAPAGVA